MAAILEYILSTLKTFLVLKFRGQALIEFNQILGCGYAVEILKN